jgi:hypothetical protein
MTENITETGAIREAVNLYIEGIRNGDVELLRSAFHPKAMMYGSGANSTTIVEIEGLFGFVAANQPPVKTGEPHHCTITAIRNSGNTAIVEMTEEAAFGNNYINYFQLLKIDEKWVIVSKAYNTTTS